MSWCWTFTVWVLNASILFLKTPQKNNLRKHGFQWDSCYTQEDWKTKVVQNFGEGGGGGK